MSVWSWIVAHKRKLLGLAVGAAGVFYPPLMPVTIGLGGLIAGSDFQVGAKVGTQVGEAAKSVVSTKTLTAADAAKLAALRELK